MKDILGVLMFFVIYLTPIAAWVTHVINCVYDDRIGLLFAGMIIFPVGIVHGIGIWFGVF